MATATATGVAVMSSSATAVLIGRNKSLSSPSSPSTATATAAAMSLSLSLNRKFNCRTINKRICCEVAMRWESNSTSMEEEDLKRKMEKVGSKVKVKAPMKVYHVAKLPDLELTPDMVGVIKQYVGFWKGKHISPNYPFKVEFLVQGQGRAGGPLKFFVHLKEDEFQIIS